MNELDPLVKSCHEVLLNAYVRVQAHHEGRTPASFSEEDRHGVAEMFASSIELEVRMLGEIIHHARVEGMQEVASALHSETGLEAVDINQALVYATDKTP